MLTILNGDCLEQLRALPDESVQCCVTSPPYWGLRDYGHPGQIGLEPTPAEFVERLVEVFREVRRVLREDGTLWLNLGDSYAGSGKGGNPEDGKQATNKGSQTVGVLYGKSIEQRAAERAAMKARFAAEANSGLKAKDLVGIPWRVAFALQADGWYLRSDIIWSKPNPMPESVTDRPTKAHEYLFLLTKSERYYYDAEAIKEQAVSDHDAGNGFAGRQGGASHLPMSGGTGTSEPWTRNGKGGKSAFRGQGSNREGENGPSNRSGRDMKDVGSDATRNKRTVWTVATQPYSDAHFATYPPDLIKPCILAGSRPGDTVLDPFGGSGTTGMVAIELGRKALLIELNPEYVRLIERRCHVTPGFAF